MRLSTTVVIGLGLALAVAASVGFAGAQSGAPASGGAAKPASTKPAGDAAPKPEYVGSVKCKICHLSEHKSWAASKHAAAFGALKPEEAKKKECVGCHAVGVCETAGALTMVEQGVGCESCHGPGSLYGTKAVMDKKNFKTDPDGQRSLYASLGLVKPTEKTCKGCHNEKSPNYKPFDFAKSSAAIKHWEDAAAAPKPAAGTGK